MSFSTEWNDRYREGAHMSVWPWSDLVSCVMCYCRPTGPEFRVLELGCGAGANIPFFLSSGVDYFGIDGSLEAVAGLGRRYPALNGKLHVGDFTVSIPLPGKFDLIIDRAALTHNDTEAIARSLNLVYAKLKSGGTFIGIDWFSTAFSEYKSGRRDCDDYTRTGYDTGAFKGVGRVHFADKPHLLQLFKDFEIKLVEHKIVRREIPVDGWEFASWNLVATKPKQQKGK